MITLSVDSTNDFNLNKSSLVLKTDLEAVIQSCEQAAKTQLGEVFLQTSRGIPNFDTIWTSGANIAQFENFLRQVILSVPDVTGIRSLTTENISNSVIYTVEIESIYGSGVVTNAI